MLWLAVNAPIHGPIFAANLSAPGSSRLHMDWEITRAIALTTLKQRPMMPFSHHTQVSSLLHLCLSKLVSQIGSALLEKVLAAAGAALKAGFEHLKMAGSQAALSCSSASDAAATAVHLSTHWPVQTQLGKFQNKFQNLWAFLTSL